jgi:hypothetical protein
MHHEPSPLIRLKMVRPCVAGKITELAHVILRKSSLPRHHIADFHPPSFNLEFPSRRSNF